MGHKDLPQDPHQNGTPLPLRSCTCSPEAQATAVPSAASMWQKLAGVRAVSSGPCGSRVVETPAPEEASVLSGSWGDGRRDWQQRPTYSGCEHTTHGFWWWRGAGLFFSATVALPSHSDRVTAIASSMSLLTHWSVTNV